MPEYTNTGNNPGNPNAPGYWGGVSPRGTSQPHGYDEYGRSKNPPRKGQNTNEEVEEKGFWGKVGDFFSGAASTIGLTRDVLSPENKKGISDADDAAKGAKRIGTGAEILDDFSSDDPADALLDTAKTKATESLWEKALDWAADFLKDVDPTDAVKGAGRVVGATTAVGAEITHQSGRFLNDTMKPTADIDYNTRCLSSGFLEPMAA
ncbi:MAG: hypothetical protein R8F89_18300 [Roseobacter sp.]|nr:hypothetical protein [Roseobacter sp.]